MIKVLRNTIVFTLIMSCFFVMGYCEELYEDEADKLKFLNIFKGSNGSFQLDELATREQGAIMVVRLIGKVDVALLEKNSHPFTDVSDWASDYVGYLYKNGLANGISDTKFGAKNFITASQYYTYVLRSLGYSDSEGDFIWSDALNYAAYINLINYSEAKRIASTDFIRNDIVFATYNALLSNVKDNPNKTLGYVLYESDAFSQEQYTYFIKMNETIIDIVEPKNNVVSTYGELETLLLYKMVNKKTDFSIDINDYEDLDSFKVHFKEIYYKSLDSVLDFNIGFLPTGYSYSGKYNDLNIELKYEDRQIVKDNISNYNDLVVFLYNMKLGFKPHSVISYYDYEGDLIDDFSKASNESSDMVESDHGVKIINSFNVSGSEYETYIDLTFDYSKDEYRFVKDKSKEIINQIITDDMNSFEIVKTIHDYVINNMEYDNKNFDAGTVPRNSYTAYGALALGVGVCEAYTEAMNVLLHEVDIPCYMVLGDADGPHVWNLISIDNNYYHLDATWDDPVMSDGSQTLTYDYFLISDDQILKDHTWDRSQYPPAIMNYEKDN